MHLLLSHGFYRLFFFNRKLNYCSSPGVLFSDILLGERGKVGESQKKMVVWGGGSKELNNE